MAEDPAGIANPKCVILQNGKSSVLSPKACTTRVLFLKCFSVWDYMGAFLCKFSYACLRACVCVFLSLHKAPQ